MTIFQKIALQGIRQNTTRTLVTVIGVILSSALITAIATFAVSLQSYMVNGSIQKYGDWQIEYTNVPSSFVQKQKSDKRVQRVISFQNIGYANPHKLPVTGEHFIDFCHRPAQIVLCPV